jgi:hypothetical protein
VVAAYEVSGDRIRVGTGVPKPVAAAADGLYFTNGW